MVNGFLLKSSKICKVRIIQFCSNFTNSWYKYSVRNYKWYFRRLMLATATVPWKGLNVELKDWWSNRLFYVTIADADIVSLKYHVCFLIKYCTTRAVASLIVPGGQEFHFPYFFLKFRSNFLIFPQTLLVFFLILALRVGELPTGKALATPLCTTDKQCFNILSWSH